VKPLELAGRIVCSIESIIMQLHSNELNMVQLTLQMIQKE